VSENGWFWVVWWRDEDGKPKATEAFKNNQAAMNEASRLSVTIPGRRFYVLESEHSIVMMKAVDFERPHSK
jgi:hypothetical protein